MKDKLKKEVAHLKGAVNDLRASLRETQGLLSICLATTKLLVDKEVLTDEQIKEQLSKSYPNEEG